MQKVRIGVIGLGNMGLYHAQYINSVENATLAAVCDVDPKRVDKAAEGNDARKFTSFQELINSGAVDALLVATPHFQHCEIGRLAFAKGIHVLAEKPLAVTIGEARQTIEAARRLPNIRFAVMFQSRTQAIWQKVRQMVTGGELGKISRITWIATDWFRTNAYYASGGWRATWKGEGGGVLINQCPHNLDLLPWLVGMMPRRITAVAALGKYHPIEVEDEVSAILEYDNGAIGHFMTTTGEAPGTNRLEICGSMGKLIIEGGAKVSFIHNQQDAIQVRQESNEAFATVKTDTSEVDYKTGRPEGHQVVTQNFVNAILNNEPLIASAEDGARGLEIGNAMLMAGYTRKPVELPLDGAAYDQLLAELAAKYGGKKNVQVKGEVKSDILSSFKHATK